ncbi:Protein kinase domain [Arabidopsis suecica]|uniref:non-specific serine/threonine protein kinase n=1 Tax=Arabidopsis suecica TaxID=45249 RepID=A0A8T1ZV26_ARASU|nr:Protein kinase domain [Arabidopsis suecica]
MDIFGGEDDDGDQIELRLSEIMVATNNFSDENKLGEGGFGSVYKGKLTNGMDVAIKRLSPNSRQGLSEFKSEIVLIEKLQHKNLVRLLGYCIERGEMLLVYEYMSNKSLDFFLFDSVKCRELNWAKRMAIVNGTVRGLQYLHEDSRLKIRHRDLKAANILLDDEMKKNHCMDIFGGEDDAGDQIELRLSEILVATNNFSDENKLGEGGFGSVYKGKLTNGMDVAIKRLSPNSRQDSVKCRELNWAKRMAIVNGTVRGLQYLHEDSRLKIIHRDLKAANILLDDEMSPKIADFGTARTFPRTQINHNTGRIVGT